MPVAFYGRGPTSPTLLIVELEGFRFSVRRRRRRRASSGWRTSSTSWRACAVTILRSPRFVLRSLSIRSAPGWISLTQGPLGIYGIPPPPALTIAGIQLADFRNLTAFFYLVSGFTFLVYLLLSQSARSPVGEQRYREDQVSAASLGINGAAWKVFAFGIGAAVGGAAGCFYASFVGTLVPGMVFVTEAFNILAMVIVGGMGTLIGPVSVRFCRRYCPRCCAGSVQPTSLMAPHSHLSCCSCPVASLEAARIVQEKLRFGGPGS